MDDETNKKIALPASISMILKILPEDFDMYGSNRVHNCVGAFSRDNDSKEKNIEIFSKILNDPYVSHLAFVPNQFGRLPVHYAVDRSSCSPKLLKLFYKHYKSYYSNFYSSLKDLEALSINGNITDSSLFILQNVRNCPNMRDRSGVSPYEIARKWGHSKSVKILLLKMLLIVLIVQNKADALLTIDQHVDSLTLASERKVSACLAPTQFSQCLESNHPSGEEHTPGTNTADVTRSHRRSREEASSNVLSNSYVEVIDDGRSIDDSAFEEEEEEDWSGTAADVSRHGVRDDVPLDDGSMADTVEAVAASLRREQYGPIFSPVVALSASFLNFMGATSSNSSAPTTTTALRKRGLSSSFSQNQPQTRTLRSSHDNTAALSGSSHTEDYDCRAFHESTYPEESRTSSSASSSAHSVASSHLTGSQHRSVHRRQRETSLEGIGEKDESAASPRTDLDVADINGASKPATPSPNSFNRFRSKSSTVFPDNYVSSNNGTNHSQNRPLSSCEDIRFLQDEEKGLIVAAKSSKSAHSLLSSPNEGSPVIARRYSKSAHSGLSPSLDRRSSPTANDAVLSLVGLGQNEGAQYGPEAGSWAGHIRRSQLLELFEKDKQQQETSSHLNTAVIPLEDSID